MQVPLRERETKKKKEKKKTPESKEIVQNDLLKLDIHISMARGHPESQKEKMRTNGLILRDNSRPDPPPSPSGLVRVLEALARILWQAVKIPRQDEAGLCCFLLHINVGCTMSSHQCAPLSFL